MYIYIYIYVYMYMYICMNCYFFTEVKRNVCLGFHGDLHDLSTKMWDREGFSWGYCGIYSQLEMMTIPSGHSSQKSQ